MAGLLAAGGYAVHGRLEELVPDTVGSPSQPRRRDALQVVLWACLQQTTADQAGDGAEDGKAAT
jgi:hypothetical protein